MEILVGLIPFVIFALIWFGVKRFTEFTHEDILFGFMTGLVVLTLIGFALLTAHLIGDAILNGGMGA